MAMGPSAIRVNAVLSAFRDHETSDVVDALCYFFVPILDKVRGNPMTGSFLAKAAGLVYGWSLTESVGEVFLERLVAKGFIAEEGNGNDKKFIAQASPEMSNSVDATIQVSFDEVTSRFEQFDLISGDLIYRHLTREELGDMLVRFLISLDAYTNETIAVELRGAAKNGELQTLKKLEADVSVLTRSETHVCARFVQQLSSEDPILAENLSLFVSAGLLAELVEDFRKPSSVESKSETIFYLDGPMLLGLIGTSGTALQNEARTIVDALKSIGCRILVLSESCLEAERVLNAYLKSQPSDRHGRTHTAVLKNEVERQFVQTVASDVEAAAAKYGVAVRDYQLDAFPNQHKFFGSDRTTDFDSFLGWENPRAREHDAYAVTAIMRMRQGKHKGDPLENSHVFISSNAKLVKKARAYCLKSHLVRENQCGPAVDVRDLATIAWLRTGFEKSDKLPISHMLAQCERVLRVRKDVVESARVQVAKFSPDKKEQFELLLQNNRSVSFLMDSSRGSAATFAMDEDQKLLDGMLDAAIKVVRIDTDRKLSEKDAALKQLRQKSSAEKAAIIKDHAEQQAALVAEHSALFLRLKDAEAKETSSARELEKVISGYHEVMMSARASVNFWISFGQIVAGIIFFFLAVSAVYSVFGGQAPRWADYGMKVLGVYGIYTTVQGLRGVGVPGFSQLSNGFGKSAFLSYCTRRGVPHDLAERRFRFEDGRIFLASRHSEVDDLTKQ
ncbi:MAG: hypothetical protein CFE33_09345 [Pseudorhodobacter sp. PARRP1]|nr:MAG: hypothetical protein CFE33_09345 [Pseudorhodobacter sp. PARRP1]